MLHNAMCSTCVVYEQGEGGGDLRDVTMTHPTHTHSPTHTNMYTPTPSKHLQHPHSVMTSMVLSGKFAPHLYLCVCFKTRPTSSVPVCPCAEATATCAVLQRSNSLINLMTGDQESLPRIIKKYLYQFVTACRPVATRCGSFLASTVRKCVQTVHAHVCVCGGECGCV